VLEGWYRHPADVRVGVIPSLGIPYLTSGHLMDLVYLLSRCLGLVFLGVIDVNV